MCIRDRPTSEQASAPPIRKPTASPQYRLQPQGEQTPEVREATTLLSVKTSPHQKPIQMKRQRAITQMREKENTPEKQLSDQEILSLQEKDFRLDAEDDARHWKYTGGKDG